MTPSRNITKSLQRLAMSIKPPANPIGLDAEQDATSTLSLPDDFYSLNRLYGTGCFENGGLFLTILNPFDDQSVSRFDIETKSIENLVKIEGEKYIPFKFHPTSPGLLLWGYGEGRKHFFWLTEGNPDCWPVVVMHDLEVITRFDMTMLEFIEKLLCGDLDCGFIGGVDTANNRITSSNLTFISGSQP